MFSPGSIDLYHKSAQFSEIWKYRANYNLPVNSLDNSLSLGCGRSTCFHILISLVTWIS